MVTGANGLALDIGKIAQSGLTGAHVLSEEDREGLAETAADVLIPGTFRVLNDNPNLMHMARTGLYPALMSPKTEPSATLELGAAMFWDLGIKFLDVALLRPNKVYAPSDEDNPIEREPVRLSGTKSSTNPPYQLSGSEFSSSIPNFNSKAWGASSINYGSSSSGGSSSSLPCI
jgi:hypothetical protein